MRHISTLFRSRTVAAALVIIFTAVLGFAQQCANLQGFARSACEALAMARAAKAQHTAAASQAVAIGQTLTTNLADAIHTDTLDPAVSPKAFAPLFSLKRADDGSFLLKPGFYEAYVESFTFDNQDGNAPRVGAFFPAPIKGPRGAIIASVLKQSELHPEIKQAAIQQLISAIYAGTDLEKMPQPIQQTAVIVLPHDVAHQLQASVQAKNVAKSVMDFLDKRAGGTAQPAQQTPANDTSSQPVTAKNDTADAPPDDPALPVVRGTWAQMPGGFYVRYLPETCAQTRVQIMVPGLAPGLADPAHPLAFDPTQYLAVLAQAPGQRLGITLRQIEGPKH